MSKVWKIAPKQSDDLITQLLINRGLKTKLAVDQFFNPNLKDYKKDIQIPNIKIAQKRIQKAIENQELIVVFGDYDVDGICASAVLYKGLTSIGAKVLPYIPHRDKEGYGLNNLGLEFARDSGAGLVITVDNGIVAFESALFAKEIGLELIITDHHLPAENKPEALTIVHSTKMCGAAVGWCLIQDLLSKTLTKELLQFVAVATVADIMPLLGVNRAFVYEGLKVLNNTDNPGLKALAACSKLTLGSIGSYEIGHILAPRLNAIGRLEHAIDALRMLCTSNLLKARQLAQLLCDTNSRRQELTVIAVEEAKLQIIKDKKIHIVHSEKWASGVIGLIAARITEEESRPAIAIAIGEQRAKGSARSVNGINIIELLRGCSDLLLEVGGHSGAAGFSLLNENIEKFKKRLDELVDKYPNEEGKTLGVESEVETKVLSKNLVKKLEDFEPCGHYNPKPILVTENMQISNIRSLSEGKHLKFLADGIEAIAFGMGQLAQVLQEGQFVDIAYCLEINKFNGNETLQLKVKDIKIHT